MSTQHSELPASTSRGSSSCTAKHVSPEYYYTAVYSTTDHVLPAHLRAWAERPSHKWTSWSSAWLHVRTAWLCSWFCARCIRHLHDTDGSCGCVSSCTAAGTSCGCRGRAPRACGCHWCAPSACGSRGRTPCTCGCHGYARYACGCATHARECRGHASSCRCHDRTLPSVSRSAKHSTTVKHLLSATASNVKATRSFLVRCMSNHHSLECDRDKKARFL